VEQIEGRFAELSEQMADPEVISDQRRYAEMGRAYRTLEPAHQLAQVEPGLRRAIARVLTATDSAQRIAQQPADVAAPHEDGDLRIGDGRDLELGTLGG